MKLEKNIRNHISIHSRKCLSQCGSIEDLDEELFLKIYEEFSLYLERTRKVRFEIMKEDALKESEKELWEALYRYIEIERSAQSLRQQFSTEPNPLKVHHQTKKSLMRSFIDKLKI